MSWFYQCLHPGFTMVAEPTRCYHWRKLGKMYLTFLYHSLKLHVNLLSPNKNFKLKIQWINLKKEITIVVRENDGGLLSNRDWVQGIWSNSMQDLKLCRVSAALRKETTQVRWHSCRTLHRNKHMWIWTWTLGHNVSYAKTQEEVWKILVYRAEKNTS